MYNILIVEDQSKIIEIVKKYLENEGYNVLTSTTGIDGLKFFNNEKIHLVILDIMLPGIDGFDVLDEIRKTSKVPVIMLTAKKLEKDKLTGFDLGADDYIVKPFSVKELVKRVNVFIKRIYGQTNDNILEFNNLKLDLNKQIIYKNNKNIEITSSEFKILKTFFENKGQVLSRNQIIEKTFGYEYEGYNRSIDTHIKRIRRKIEDDYKNPEFIKTKYGAGYIFGGKNET
ncbi:MAG: response regulator transcription factor [Bacillota bacterium]